MISTHQLTKPIGKQAVWHYRYIDRAFSWDSTASFPVQVKDTRVRRRCWPFPDRLEYFVVPRVGGSGGFWVNEVEVHLV